MKSSHDRFNLASNLSDDEIYNLERTMWLQMRKSVIDPSEILDNNLKQGVIKHLNEKYGQ